MPGASPGTVPGVSLSRLEVVRHRQVRGLGAVADFGLVLAPVFGLPRQGVVRVRPVFAGVVIVPGVIQWVYRADDIAVPGSRW
jgi:hypothetical protein